MYQQQQLYYQNKTSSCIIYNSVSGSFSSVSLDDFLLENPSKTKADFLSLKSASDSLFYDEFNNDNRYTYNVVSDDFLNHKFLSTKGCLADLLVGSSTKQSSTINKSLLVDLLHVSIRKDTTILTSLQRRRFIKYFIKNMTIESIAKSENKAVSSVWESLSLAKKKLYNHFYGNK